MRKIFFIFCVILTQNLICDESIKNEQNSTKTEQNISVAPFENYEIFKQQIFQMPNNAKILSSINIEYIDDLGKKYNKIIDINKSIDNNSNFVFESRKKADISKVLDVSVTKGVTNSKNSVSGSVEIELPLENLKFDNELRFIINKSGLLMITKDKLTDFKRLKKGVFKAVLKRDNLPFSFVGYHVNKGGFIDINVSKETEGYSVRFGYNGKLKIENQKDGYIINKKSD